MVGRFDSPRDRTPVWEPEPLHIPVYDPSLRRRDPSEQETPEDDDLPGSHVVVFDL